MKSPRNLLFLAVAALLAGGAVVQMLRQREHTGSPAAPAVDNPAGKRARDGGTTSPAAQPAGTGSEASRDEDDPAVRDPGFSSDAVAAILADQQAGDITVRNRLVDFAADPGHPLAERSEALDHAIRLTLPDDISALIKLASSQRLPEALHEQILGGAMNLTGPPRLQLMLALLEQANDEQRATLLENLRFLTGEDHGDDLAKWRVAIEVLESEPPGR